MTAAPRPRAAGRRVGYATLPAHLHAWVEAELGGRVVHDATQVGGMSSGPASRLLLDDGRRAFVKAVGSNPNPRTPELFRHEIAVLGRLPAVHYRPALLAAYDDGDWVALLLEDVDGRHPDLDDPADADAVREVVRAQAAELSAAEVGVVTDPLADRVRRWHDLISSADSGMRIGLPDWWVAEEDALMRRIAALGERVADGTWCHFDVRDDNLLVRRDGRAAVVDWGMSCAGPSWADELLLDAHWVDTDEFDRLVAARGGYADSADLDADATDVVLTLGSTLAVMAEGPAPVGLPWITDFRRTEGRRWLAGARRRLGL